MTPIITKNKQPDVSMVFFGLVIVALGAEIPDTIQSFTVAKRGYGSMVRASAGFYVKYD